ncbi:MAG: phosphopantothenoylcysteine decarboxylase [Terrimicrobiaceae bacterium]|nr:phosphopantothenoylcysteine decarboxylase [Terrimicrobiaceae bacterium]
MGLICITCGPASAPIDKVRRITNFATGEIGRLLSDVFAEAGFRVVCFRGMGATAPVGSGELREFSTNESLAAGLWGLTEKPVAIFHAAAMCDFDVAAVEGGSGGKLDSRGGGIRLVLKPARKILPDLRGWFPDAFLVGWKFEVDGTRDDVVAKGRRQLAEAHTDLCVINGPAFGEGFGILDCCGDVEFADDKQRLALRLLQIFQSRQTK